MITTWAEPTTEDILNSDMVHDALCMLFVELMTGTPLLRVMSTSETSTVASESHTSDGIKDRKLVLVAKNQANRLRPQITQLGHLITTIAPVVRLGSNQLVSYERLVRVVIVRDIQPIGDGGASTASDHVEAFYNDVSNYRCC
jgi:hypothetical protein